ncbi:MAG: Hsp70 family protein [Planctomycetes bacterium]|nr:Hsp70 family protein [Planctomycetota bacterium]
MNARGCQSVGIDLGTTYSAMAYLDEQMTPRMVQDGAGQAVIPSVVFFDEEEVIVGDIALQQARVRSDRVVQFVKVHMGDDWKQEFDGQVQTPESISAIILAHLVREAEPQIGPVTSVVITVPAYFTEKRRRATQQAGEIAGLTVIGTLNEPMAAALAFGLYREDKEQVAVVYDLGGGTFDVTVVRITPNALVEMATYGNRQLGGRDWDRCLVDHVADEFQKAYNVDPRESPQTLQDLLITCEEAKRRLGRMNQTAIRLNALGHDHTCKVTREQFETMTASLLQTTKLTTELALEDANVTWDDVDRIVVVGGSTHMPMVRKMLREISGKDPDTGVNPVLAVALGAAQYAHLLEAGQAPEAVHQQKKNGNQAKVSEIATVELKDDGDEAKDEKGLDPFKDKSENRKTNGEKKPPPGNEDDLELEPLPSNNPPPIPVALPRVGFVTAHGVGVKAMIRGKKSNVVLIHKNSRVPCEVSQRFKTIPNSRGEVRRHIPIEVTQGDTPHLELAECVGVGNIEGIPADAPPGRPVKVTMSFDVQGRLHVEAVYVDTGQQLQIELTIPGGLAEEEVRQYRQIMEDTGLITPFDSASIADVELISQFEHDAEEEDDDEDIPILEPVD